MFSRTNVTRRLPLFDPRLRLQLQRHSQIGVEISTSAADIRNPSLRAPPHDVVGGHRPFIAGEIADLGLGQVGAERPAEIRLGLCAAQQRFPTRVP